MNLEAEIHDLAARRDIQKALFAYMRGQDRLDPILQLSAFHPDAEVDCGLMRGTAQEFVDFAQGFLSGVESSHHLIAQMDIGLAPGSEVATGEIYFSAWHRLIEAGRPQDLVMAGRYVDEYRVKDGTWAIQRRREIIDWAQKTPASDSVLAEMPQLHLGARGGADFSQVRDGAGRAPHGVV